MLPKAKIAFFVAAFSLAACESPAGRSRSRDTRADEGRSHDESRTVLAPTRAARADEGRSLDENRTVLAPTRAEVAPGESLAGCEKRFAKRNFCAKLAWVQSPRVNQEAKATLTFSTAEGSVYSEVGADSIKLFLAMKAHGHGAPPVELFEDRPGEIAVENMIFTMPGAWQIHVQILDDRKAVVDEAVWEIVL